MSFKRKRRAAPPSFVHLKRMTDDTGLLEHALGRIPRRREGYTTDDNARALWTVTEWLSAADEARLGREDRELLLSLASNYLAFLLWNQREDGWWHNNVAYDRSPEPEEISHDCQGRSIWSVADAWVRLPATHKDAALCMLERALRTIGRIDSLRGQAFAMAACAHILEADRDGAVKLPNGWREELRRHVDRIEDLMIGAFRHFSDDRWRWFEPAMTYGNGALPWAMLRAYRLTRRPETLEAGLDSLSSLQTVMTSDEGWFRPIGNDGWCTSKAVSRWDQQPLEMFKLALALEEAARALEAGEREGISLLLTYDATFDKRKRPRTGAQPSERSGAEEPLATVGVALAVQPDGAETEAPDNAQVVSPARHAAFLRESRDRCLDWFFGDNDLDAPMADASDGSCCDGLQANGPNVNCGAEATLSYLMTEALCRHG
ncbi:hypothetical protein [Cohnella sp. REN36]|uniref:hypothetical protein n=1 Tax=Cohnella sp. REN36 TaxID=2887347 RepID=UPI001D157BED|nr:hypothetical protein [Cohnella sp. REN36]MCC3375763.1 hypothetical protein [Cohnella sp. REN36]